MNEERSRRIGAIIGLVAGVSIMFAAGMSGVFAGFVFGAGGTVMGAIAGEKFYASRR